jgi:hypothetical protein
MNCRDVWNPAAGNDDLKRGVFRTREAGFIVRRLETWVLGIWRGEGLGKDGERGGQFTGNLRPRWTDPVTARRVSK